MPSNNGKISSLSCQPSHYKFLLSNKISSQETCQLNYQSSMRKLPEFKRDSNQGRRKSSLSKERLRACAIQVSLAYFLLDINSRRFWHNIHRRSTLKAALCHRLVRTYHERANQGSGKSLTWLQQLSGPSTTPCKHVIRISDTHLNSAQCSITIAERALKQGVKSCLTWATYDGSCFWEFGIDLSTTH